ncbi:receptor/non-receptor type protein-tyrosine phosphatase [Polychaeton citri CBS 116435]|uniref:Receptor/non-receptor type protein-tyrosine phosphatase n=1 Tax=Polychaeton citri CBS 116435 TaxID=1314669 RepID=A0A9P4UR02_9PEZI|nr:receptor/non-receptor type protein-tyrosine phosphatase [Polychaeton citri CBS 116435]
MAAHSEPPAFLKQSKSDIRNKFVDLEWAQRNRLLAGAQASTNGSEQPHQFARLTGDSIMARNRYLNVEPYASNRVKLQVTEGTNDYINASPIQLGNRRYIATQGPKDCSVNHFYRMVTGEVAEPIVVVMLTQTHESGKEKCFQYYPLSAEESPLIISPDADMADGFQGEVILEDVREDSTSHSEHRRLRVSAASSDGSNTDKAIHHLLFSGWPDFLVPEGEDKDALVQLIHLSARLNAPTAPSLANGAHGSSFDFASSNQSNPRIVHCSAGVGRSGTFIALDYLLSLLFSGQLDSLTEDQDPVAETVDAMRQQRMMMVQGEAQFNFIYEVMKEQWQARSQAV